MPKTKSKSIVKLSLKMLLSVVVLVAVLVATAVVVVELPLIGKTWLRHKVASRVFEIKGAKDGGGGTGFQIEAPSGTSYIVTNSHVCELAIRDGKEKNFLLVAKNDRFIKRRVLEVSDQSDLCLVEGWPGLSGLKVGSEVVLGDTVVAVGHPLLGPITVTVGEVTSFSDVTLLHHIMKTGNARIDRLIEAEEGSCDQPKNEIRREMFYFLGFIPMGLVNKCLVTEVKAITTNVIIYPGSSGSPLVTRFGQVVGVMFASDRRTHWGDAVNLQQLMSFLADY